MLLVGCGATPRERFLTFRKHIVILHKEKGRGKPLPYIFGWITHG